MAFNTSQGLQGAAGGAALGSTFGPMGTIAGGAIGGLLGGFGGSSQPRQEDFMLPGFQERQGSLNQAISSAGQVRAPSAQAAQIGQFGQAGMGGDFRTGQGQLIGQLQQQAMGQGPSLATGQFNQALGAGMASQNALANTGTGNAALAGRQAAQNIGGMTQDLAGQAAQARMQEQMQARQQLAGVLGQARAQEMQGSQFNTGQLNQRLLAQAGFDQQTGLANMDAILRNQALQNQYGLGLRGLELQNARAQQGGLMGFAGSQQPNQIGTQLLSGGGAALASQFGQGQPQQQQIPSGLLGGPAPRTAAQSAGGFDPYSDANLFNTITG